MLIAHAIYALSHYMDPVKLAHGIGVRGSDGVYRFHDGSRIAFTSDGIDVAPALPPATPTITDAAKGLQAALNASATHAASVDVQVSPINVQTISEAKPRNVWQVRVRVNSHTDYSS